MIYKGLYFRAQKFNSDSDIKYKSGIPGRLFYLYRYLDPQFNSILRSYNQLDYLSELLQYLNNKQKLKITCLIELQLHNTHCFEKLQP